MHICLLSSYLRRTRLDFNPRPSAPFFFRFLERFTTTLRDGRTRFFFFFNPSMNESEYRSANKNRKHLLVKFVELLECNVLWKRVEIGHGDRLLESWRDFVPFLLLKLTICSQSCSYESLVFFFFFNFDGKNISIEMESLQTYKRMKTRSIYTRILRKFYFWMDGNSLLFKLVILTPTVRLELRERGV